jgi:hypothetical protein
MRRRTKTEKIGRHIWMLCGIDFGSAEELVTHKSIEHSGDAHSPAGVG